MGRGALNRAFFYMSVESDLATLKAYTSDFDPYLKSDVIFWNVGKANTAALSMGGMLFLRRTLNARRAQLSPAQIQEFEHYELQIDDLLNHWKVRTENKALSEISSRFNIWNSAFEDLTEHYSNAVNNRVYLALLLPIIASLPDSKKYEEKLGALDRRLQNIFVTGEFIWDAALTSAFPRTNFWFLYGKPNSSVK